MKRILLCAVVVASSWGTPARADTLAPDAPQRLRVYEDLDLDSFSPATNTNKIFLNFCPSGCVVAPGSTNSTLVPDRSNIIGAQGMLSKFSRGATVQQQVVDCVKDVFSRFGTEIVTVDPGAVPHFEIMIAGQPGQVGFPSGVGGVSPFNCNAEYIPNSLVFVFDVWGSNVNEICATAAQELAHSFRLDHVTDPSDPLTYFTFSGRRQFKDAQVQCGSDCVQGQGPMGQICAGTIQQNHACSCTGSQTQNSVATLTSLFGAGTPIPPDVKITSPKTGDLVDPGFPVRAEATDLNGISLVELRINGMLTQQLATAPYAFNAPANLADGTYTVEVTGIDNFGASTRKSVQVIIGDPCSKPSDCVQETDTCIGGRCVAGPNAVGGLGTNCADNAACVSMQCASDSTGEHHCVETCKLGEGECPSGFGCLEAGPDQGVCWPGYDDGTGGCCQAGARPDGPVFLGLGVLVLALRRRRRR